MGLTGTGKYREIQRITVPYARLLGIINEHSSDQAMITDL
jgi:protein HIRA/HIR1